MFPSGSRSLVEIAIILGLVNILIGVMQKLANLTTVYLRQIFGLTPMDFILLAGVCFLFASAMTGRKVLKYIDFKTSQIRSAVSE